METIGSGMQYLTDGRYKYIWYPALGLEQFFDLKQDPQELDNLAGNPNYGDMITLWRKRLIKKLEGREEKFVVNGELVKLPGPTRVCVNEDMIRSGKSDVANTVGFF